MAQHLVEKGKFTKSARWRNFFPKIAPRRWDEVGEKRPGQLPG
jgi:hypothetical protein